MPPRTDSERIAVIEEIVVRMEKSTERFERRLFGNSDSGELGEINHLDARITKLENWRWWVVGIAVGLGFTAGGFGHKVIEVFAK